jgi:GT2 family glycosyltransferase
MDKLAVLITAHNRKASTLNCLNTLFTQKSLLKNLAFSIFLVDDGCTDGTPQAVVEQFPSVEILKGTGSLYWCGGTHLAFAKALQYNFEYYLWLNDDTNLHATALAALVNVNSSNPNAIVVGSLKDPITTHHTYGGVRRVKSWHPLKFEAVHPQKMPLPIDTMNGNLVLIPRSAAHIVGNLDASFTHGIGDFDYGLRARKLGVKLLLAPGYQGTCTRNHIKNTWEDKTLPFYKRWNKIKTPHGLPPREWAFFAKRYAGPFWPFFWLLPYVRSILPR